mgnify:CR=1
NGNDEKLELVVDQQGKDQHTSMKTQNQPSLLNRLLSSYRCIIKKMHIPIAEIRMVKTIRSHSPKSFQSG